MMLCKVILTFMLRIYQSESDHCDSPKDLGRSSTIEDIADFVADYIVSDLLGVVSSKLMQSRFPSFMTSASDNVLAMTVADKSTLGFDDPDCKILTKLASAAVDYPKVSKTNVY